ncbi:MAG: aminopeptidase [Clostridia bacterium]|nr:aminopeptidase [Clostridia bacterium]
MSEEEKTAGQKRAEELCLKPKTVYEGLSEEIREAALKFCVPYAEFLNRAKTEREAVKEGIRLAEDRGFRPYRMGQSVQPGEKYYYSNRGKSLHVFVIGSEPLDNGIRISAAHIDSPRLDLKQHPVYEESGFCYLKTHYYGGIRKYQWLTIPLALHGTVCRRDGRMVDICIGEEESDPLFYITDLLPHLARELDAKAMGKAVDPENLNALVCATPFDDEKVSDKVKLQFLSLMNEKYGLTEADLISAELCLVPAVKARDIGIDRTLLASYGHDDRVCAYPMLQALMDCENPVHTIYAIFADKEETGSDGPTGMKSDILPDMIEELSRALGADSCVVRSRSKCLSADVNAAFDPAFASVYDTKNASYVNRGVVVTKFTGHGGKYSTNDASAEYVGYIHNLLWNNGILFQTGELGKIEAGGGGTVAMHISGHNIDTVDIGVPVLSMHAPYEVVSKFDVYETYRCCLAFNSDAAEQ